MNYFTTGMTADEAKTLFRKLAVQFHPDKPTGSHEAFLDLQNQYEKFLRGSCGYTAEKAEQETEAFEMFIRANEFIKSFVGVNVNLVGSWIWLDGNTFTYKDAIKENGFSYSSSKKKWYKSPVELKGKRRKGMNYSKIVETYGCSTYTIKDETMKVA